MKQPHTEESIKHTDGEQDTGNHKVPGTPDAGGADKFGGTRAGADNVETGSPGGASKDDAANAAGKQLHERHPETDERGRT